jgi:hypothetical protein
MVRFVKYFVVIGLIFLIPISVKPVKPVNKKLACVNYCNLHGLQCYGYIEKSIYDGNKETDKLLNTEEFMVCFEPKQEFESLL